MQTDFPMAGADWNGTEEKRARLDEAVQRMKWSPARAPAPFSQGYALKAAIQQFQIPKVEHVSWHGGGIEGEGEDGDGGGIVLGLDAQYANGRARVYIMDAGSKAAPVRIDFYPSGEEPPPLAMSAV